MRVYKLESSAVTRLQNQARDVRQLTLEIKSRLSELHEEMEALAEWFHRIETISAITAASDVTRVSVPGLAPKPESTEGGPWGQPLKKPAGAPLNLG